MKLEETNFFQTFVKSNSGGGGIGGQSNSRLCLLVKVRAFVCAHIAKRTQGIGTKQP